MLSLSNAAKLESFGDKAVSRFRPWWEVLTFYSLNCLLMAILFSLAGITISGTYNIRCFPDDKDMQLDSSIMNYVSSRCSRIFDGKHLIYFPYWMLLEWSVFFVIHLLWFKMPATFFLFQQLSEVFSEFSTIKPVEFNTEKRILRGNAGSSSKLTGLHLPEDKETKQKIRNLVVRLKEIARLSHYLVFMYTIKSLFLCITNVVVFVVLANWLRERRWRASFNCDFSDRIPYDYKDLTCSLPAAPFLYGLMICNTVLAFSISVCNLFALNWTRKFFMYTYVHYKNAFKKWTDLVDENGFMDFCFCLSLATTSYKDGKILGDVIYSSMKIYYQSNRHVWQIGQSENSKKKAKFAAMFYQGDAITKELGLTLFEGDYTDDSLFQAMAAILDVEREDFRDTISKQLKRDMHLYKDIVDNAFSNLEFERFVKLIENGKRLPYEFHQLILMAACNSFGVNILLLTCGQSCWYYKTANEEENASVDEEMLTKYLFVCHPNYYSAILPAPNYDETKEKRRLFLNNKKSRKEARSNALDNWNEFGEENYLKMIKDISPRTIAYGKTTIPTKKRSHNILTDLFHETGHKIVTHLRRRITIPPLTIPMED